MSIDLMRDKPTVGVPIGQGTNGSGAQLQPVNPAYNTYVGARYVPIFAGEWDATKTYEPLTIVMWQGNSYTSKTFVPAQTEIGNEDFWALTGNYNAQVEVYRQEVQDLLQKMTGKIGYYETFPDFVASGESIGYVLGFKSKTDGGSGIWKITENETDFSIQQNNNFYTPVYGDTVNLAHVGAPTNGVDDASSYLQTAVSVARNVFIPMAPGNIYNIAKTINLRHHKTFIFSESKNKEPGEWVGHPSYIYFTGTGTLFNTTHTNLNTFENLLIVADEIKTKTKTAIYAEDKTLYHVDLTVKNCKFYNFHIVVNMYGRGLFFFDNFMSGVDAGVSIDFPITPDDTDDATLSRNYMITRNNFHNIGRAIQFAQNAKIRFLEFAENYSSKCNQLFQSLGDFEMQNCSFTGNVMAAQLSAIYAPSGGALNDCVISSNDFRSDSPEATWGINVNSASNTVFSSNVFTNYRLNGININTGSKNIAIGNVINGFNATSENRPAIKLNSTYSIVALNVATPTVESTSNFLTGANSIAQINIPE